jgi:septal ring factor EnvC (AmiA/AmiB activator)
MSVAIAIVIAVVALGIAVWLAYSALGQVRQLRTELDQTQSQLNDTRRELGSTRDELGEVRRELNELKAAAEVLPPPPPPLPRARSAGLDDLREQLRAAHRDEESTSEE